jgi:hypothetical protein
VASRDDLDKGWGWISASFVKRSQQGDLWQVDTRCQRPGMDEQHRPTDERKTESGDWISTRKKESTQQDNIL